MRAGVMADVTDSKSVGLIPRVGSSPTTGTRKQGPAPNGAGPFQRFASGTAYRDWYGLRRETAAISPAPDSASRAAQSQRGVASPVLGGSAAAGGT